MISRRKFMGSLVALSAFAALPLSRNATTNLIVNPNFDQPISDRFNGWHRLNNHWRISRKRSNPSPNDTAAKLGQDGGRNGPVGWPIGGEDWLWQDVSVSGEHSQVVFTITEIQHMKQGVAESRLYGWNGRAWQEIWYRPFPDAPRNTPKTRTDWYTYTYTIPASFSRYRLEFYGKLLDSGDGWKFTLLELSVS